MHRGGGRGGSCWMGHDLLLLMLLRKSWWPLSKCLCFYYLNWGWLGWCELGVYNAILHVQNLLLLSLLLPLLLWLLLLLWVVGGHVYEVL